MSITGQSGQLVGKTALITGSASGIGRAIAQRFAAEGAEVLLTDLAPLSRETGIACDAEIREAGGKANFIAADLRDDQAVQEIFRAARSITGRLDIVVSNAGTFRGAPIDRTTPEDFDQDMDLNLRSHYLVNRAAIDCMLTQEIQSEARGRIINMCSQLGMTAPPGHMTYAVAKAGIAHMTRQLAVDYGRHHIVINGLAPGRILTGYHPGEADYLEGGVVDEAMAFSLARTPFHRLGKPADIAGPALFLASDDCRFVSGHILTVDGGWTAY
jgi:NAD(P)-dependent dehydrogenase (short-subunit alcohol dehydrogenase family)